MPIAMAERARESHSHNQTVSSAVPHESKCSRCGGLMVMYFCMDLLNSTGDLEFAAKRCVQCGEVIDPVIQRNRRLRQESMNVRFAEKMLSSNGVTEAR